MTCNDPHLEEILVTGEMGNLFTSSTKDTNRIHDPLQVEKPIVPGFQLEAIALSMARQYLNKMSSIIYYPKRTNFRRPLMFGKSAYLTLLKYDDCIDFYFYPFDIDTERIISGEIDKKNLIAGGKISALDDTEIPDRDIGIPYHINESDLQNFLASIRSSDPNDAIMFPISLSSNGIIRYIENNEIAFPKNKEVVYTQHSLLAFSPIRGISVGDTVFLHTSFEEARPGFYKFVTHCFKGGTRLYEAELTLAVIDKIW